MYEKIKPLLIHEEIEFVKQGIMLLDAIFFPESVMEVWETLVTLVGYSEATGALPLTECIILHRKNSDNDFPYIEDFKCMFKDVARIKSKMFSDICGDGRFPYFRHQRYVLLWFLAKIFSFPEAEPYQKKLFSVILTFHCGLPDNHESLYFIKKLEIRHGIGSSELSEDIRGFTNLEYLECSTTTISVLPDWISELQELQSLSLVDTDTTFLPESLTVLPKLTTFRFKWQQQWKHGFPRIFCRMPKLEQLNIETTVINDDIPKEITNLVNLKLFSASSCQITGGVRYLGDMNIDNIKLGNNKDLGSFSQARSSSWIKRTLRHYDDWKHYVP